jgi:hypothetical protein
MRMAFLLLAVLTVACDSSHQSVNIDKTANRTSVRQWGDGSAQALTTQGIDGKISATQFSALSATSQTVNVENASGNVSVEQTSTGWGNAQTINIRNATNARNISQSQSGFFNRQEMNIGNAK